MSFVENIKVALFAACLAFIPTLAAGMVYVGAVQTKVNHLRDRADELRLDIEANEIRVEQVARDERERADALNEILAGIREEMAGLRSQVAFLRRDVARLQ